MLTEQKVKELRKDFPIFDLERNGKRLVYLDNSATAQRPKQVIDAVSNFSAKENANIHRGVYQLSENATQKYELARVKCAKFINASVKEIVFTANTTQAINLIAYTITPLCTPGKDEIVLSEMEHHANLIPWQQLAKKTGMKLSFIKVKDDFTLDYEDAKEKITKKTALVAVTHVSNVLGTINDIELLITLAKAKGALTLIDAAQSVPHMAIDVKRLDCDFLAFSGHKMLGPTGIGVLYGKAALLEKMSPFLFGGGMIAEVTKENATWAAIPHKFEAGTQNVAESIGFTAATSYLHKIGMENIQAWEKELLVHCLERMKEIKGITVYNPGAENSIGIISFNLEGMHPHDVASLLDDHHIAIRAGHHCCMPLMQALGINGTCRASVYFYNTKEDIDALIEGLKKAQEVFCGRR